VVWSVDAKYLFDFGQKVFRASVIVGRQRRELDPRVVHKEVRHVDFAFRLANAVADQDQVAASISKYV